MSGLIIYYYFRCLYINLFNCEVSVWVNEGSWYNTSFMVTLSGSFMLMVTLYWFLILIMPSYPDRFCSWWSWKAEIFKWHGKILQFFREGRSGKGGRQKSGLGFGGGPLRNNCLFQIYGFFCNYFFQFLTLFRIFVSLYVCLSKLKERRSVGVGVRELLHWSL